MDKFERQMITALIWAFNAALVGLVAWQMVQAANCHSVVCQ